jgi:hypothetical protein
MKNDILVWGTAGAALLGVLGLIVGQVAKSILSFGEGPGPWQWDELVIFGLTPGAVGFLLGSGISWVVTAHDNSAERFKGS